MEEPLMYRIKDLDEAIFSSDNQRRLAQLCLKIGGELYVDSKESVKIVKCKITRDKLTFIDITLPDRITIRELDVYERKIPVASENIRPTSIFLVNTSTQVDPSRLDLLVFIGRRGEIELDNTGTLKITRHS